MHQAMMEPLHRVFRYQHNLEIQACYTLPLPPFQ